MKVKLANGKEYDFAPLAFTDEAVELFCMYERLQSATEQEKDSFPFGSMLKALLACMKASLAVNHSAKEIAEAQRALPLGVKGGDMIEQITKAMISGD